MGPPSSPRMGRVAASGPETPDPRPPDKGPRDATRVGENGQRLRVGLPAVSPPPAARAQVKPRLCFLTAASSWARHVTPLAFESFNYKTRRSHWANAEVHPGAGIP